MIWPPWEWPTTTVGPSWNSSTSRSRATLSADSFSGLVSDLHLGRGQHAAAGVLVAPVQREVRDVFPAGLADREVAAALELAVVGVRRGLVVLEVRAVHGRGHDVVGAAGDEQQRRALVVVEVDPGVLVTGREVGQDAVPDPAAGGGDVVALVDLGGLLVAERVGER